MILISQMLNITETILIFALQCFFVKTKELDNHHIDDYNRA